MSVEALALPVVGIVIPPVVIATLWALLAIAAKRWHDLDKGGGWNLLLLVAAPLIVLYLGLARGTPGENRYGEPGGSRWLD